MQLLLEALEPRRPLEEVVASARKFQPVLEVQDALVVFRVPLVELVSLVPGLLEEALEPLLEKALEPLLEKASEPRLFSLELASLGKTFSVFLLLETNRQEPEVGLMIDFE